MDIVDLGYINGWKHDSIPEIYQKCVDARENREVHDIEWKTIGRCLNKTTCKTCGWTYKVDSSD